VIRIILVSPDGIFIIAYLPSLAFNCAYVPAPLEIDPPLPGFNSIL
jgi:hypothetical protein